MMRMRSIRRELAALLCALSLGIPCAQAAELPTREHFSLGMERMAAQAQSGRALEASMAIRPGFLPVAGREAASALRQILSGAQVTYLRQGAGERSEQVLRILSGGAPLLTLTHAQRGERAVWCMEPGMEQGVETPAGIDLFTALLGLPLAGDAFVAATPTSEMQAWNAQAALLLQGAAGQEMQLTVEAANRMLDLWRGAPEVPSALRALAADWRAVEGMALLYQPDALGGFAELQLRGQMAYKGGEPWHVGLLCKQEATDKRHAYILSATVSRGKSVQYKVSGTVLLKRISDARVQRELELDVSATLGGKISTLRLGGKETNDFSLLGDQLQEQILQDYTLRIKGRELGLERLGLDEWQVSFAQQGTFLSGEAADAPATYDGVGTLTMTRSRKDFFTAEIPVRLVTGEAREVRLPDSPAVWESLGDAERAQLENLRAAMELALISPMMQELDQQTKDGLWVRP